MKIIKQVNIKEGDSTTFVIQRTEDGIFILQHTDMIVLLAGDVDKVIAALKEVSHD